MRIEKPQPRVRTRTHATPMFTPAWGLHEQLYHPLVQSVLHILRELVASGGVRLVGDAPDEERELFAQLLRTRGYTSAVRHLATAHVAGVSVVEIVWDEKYMPYELRSVPPEAAQLGLDESGEIVSVRVTTSAGQQDLPITHAVVVSTAPAWYIYGGRELPIRALRKYLQAYDRVLRSIDLYLQRHAIPTTIAKTPASYTEQETQELYDALSRMQDALVAVLPDTETQLEFLEPRGTGMDLGLRMLELLERLVARTLLGGILAVYEAQYGTRAQAQVHWEVMQRLISAVQQPIEHALHTQLWTRVCQYQLGREPVGVLELNELETVQRSDILRNIGDLVALGMVDPERDREWLRALMGLSDTGEG
jgi:hypothetical protein